MEWNIRGLNTKLNSNAFEQVLDTADIIFLTETKSTLHTIDTYHYTITNHPMDRAISENKDTTNTGGIAIAIKRTIPSTAYTITKKYENIITIRIEPNKINPKYTSKPITIIGAYILNDQCVYNDPQKTEKWDNLQKAIDESKKEDTLIITADFNARILDEHPKLYREDLIDIEETDIKEGEEYINITRNSKDANPKREDKQPTPIQYTGTTENIDMEDALPNPLKRKRNQNAPNDETINENTQKPINIRHKNKNGQELLELIKRNSLVNLHGLQQVGHTIKNKEDYDDGFTFSATGREANSTIDYILINYKDHERANNFKITTNLEQSDHYPIYTDITIHDQQEQENKYNTNNSQKKPWPNKNINIINIDI